MNKLFTILIFILGLQFNMFSQGSICPTCPSLFSIKDTIGCNNVEIRKSTTSSTGFGNAPFFINACKNSIMKYQISVDPICFPNINYTFVSISGGTILNFNNNEFLVQWGSSSTATIILAFDYQNTNPIIAGCKDSITLSFNLYNTPVAAFTSSPQPACFNNPTTINFNSSGTLNATNYLWDFGDGFTSTLSNPSHNYSAPGNYVVTLIVANIPTNNGISICPTCIDSVKKTITISNLPAPPISCVATVCGGSSETYCTTAAPCATYVWAVTGGTITSGQNTSCITVLWGNGATQGSINLIVSGCALTYCPQGNTVNIPIISTVGTITGPALVCVNTTQVYNLPAWPGTTYSWLISGGGVINPFNTNTSQVNINWTTVGSHTITCNYFDTALNCGGIATFNVLVRPSMSINGSNQVCLGTTTTLTATRPTLIGVASNWVVPSPNTLVSGNGTSSININWTSVGVYNVTANNIVTNTVCNIADFTVTVLPNPIITAIIGPDSICPGGTSVYKVSSNMVGVFNWNASNSTSIINLGVNNDSVQITWAATGPYVITVNQVSFPSGCVSNIFSKTVYSYPIPIIVGPTSVCADNTVTYSITNIINGNFNWFVNPATFGTIISGQGTSNLTIKWHGNNSPGTSNIVYLHFGVCNSDSIAITINEPTTATITPSGTLCGLTGITLSTGAIGIFTWTGPIGYTPPAIGAVPSITGLNIPGNYVVQISNYNGTGCSVTANYNIPSTGFPLASISATNVINYCLPNLPNMNLVAASAPGYNFQWYLIGTGAVGTNSSILPINTLTTVGTYSYYCVITLGTCTAISNVITITISNCPTVMGCLGTIDVTSITGCNPFTLAINITSPLGATLAGTGNPSILHFEDGLVNSGYTTKTYTTVGYKQVRICVDVQMPGLGAPICRICKDTTVEVKVAANFSKIVNCKSVSLFDASTTIAPAVITNYNWSVGAFPGNTAVPIIIANYNNNAIANPILNITQSGTYIITETITTSGVACVVFKRDTITIIIPNANFNVLNSCVGTPVLLNNISVAPNNYWDFGDAATSYTSPTTHAYATANTFNITHIVTLANGCKDTVVNPVTIVAAPICNITYSTPLTFCFNDSVVLKACIGLTNIQWYNNGIAIPGAIYINDTVKQTGNYCFTAISPSGCIVKSDTASVSVNQIPNATIFQQGSTCFGKNFSVQVPPCFGCTFNWEVDGISVGTSIAYNGTSGTAPFTIGSHIIKVIVVNSLGCVDSSSITKVFYALPTISISVIGPAPFCSNNLYTLNAISNATSPTWSWVLNNTAFVIGTNSSLNVSAAGNYNIFVKDGITGCTNKTVETILPSPELNLFPIGCDTLCDTTKLFLPLQSLNGNLTGYTIDWYDNGAPLYTLPFYSGISVPLTFLPLGAHVISVIVKSPNGCRDTSNIYSVFTIPCITPLSNNEITLMAKQKGGLAVISWMVNDELNVQKYILEKSIDGINFTSIFEQNKTTNQSNNIKYYFNDPITIFNKLVYYRVKIMNKNGSYNISNIISINSIQNKEEYLQIIPNKVSNTANVFIQSQNNLKTKINVFSTDGKLVLQMPISLVKGMNFVPLNLSKLLSGIYYVSIVTNTTKLNLQILKE